VGRSRRHLLSLTLLGATLTLFSFPVLADTFVYNITAYIDGQDLLIIHGSTLQWHHLDYAAVGRWNGQNIPTTISSTLNGTSVMNGYQWTPNWPYPPPNEIRFEAYSSVFGGLAPLLPPSGAVTVTLTPIQARGSVTISQMPTPSNNNTLIIDFDDDAISEAAYYIAQVTVETGGTGGGGQCGATDITNQVKIFQGAYVPLPPLFEIWTESIQITNVSGSPIAGPLYLVFDGLPQTGTVYCPSPGACAVYPYLAVTHCQSPSPNGGSIYGPVAAGPLSPSQTLKMAPTFLPATYPTPYPANWMFQHTLRVFSGMPTQ
jgi:hypothetical protein